jgi:hypothetical protein
MIAVVERTRYRAVITAIPLLKKIQRRGARSKKYESGNLKVEFSFQLS